MKVINWAFVFLVRLFCFWNCLFFVEFNIYLRSCDIFCRLLNGILSVNEECLADVSCRAL